MDQLFINPVLNQDFPDPDVLKVNDVYYAYATSDRKRNIQVARSRDLMNWEVLPDALPVLPKWADSRYGWTWAPEVVQAKDGRYVMYFTARYPLGRKKGRQCIAVAVSDHPEGPFQSMEETPFIAQLDEGGAIDPYVFTDEDGIRYLLWKNDGNSCGERTWIYLRRISEDGLSLEGEASRLLTTDQPWEGKLVEAPTLWKHEGKYYLFYSANSYTNSRYAIGYAVADELRGPYRKSEKPLLMTHRNEGIIGPGGQDITTTPDGRTWLVYHSWSAKKERCMHISELVWDGEVPVVKKPIKTV